MPVLNVLVAPRPMKRLVVKDVVLGPSNEGVTGEQFTTQWKLGWADNTLQMYKIDNAGGLTQVEPIAPFPQLVYANVTQIGLVFDQSSRAIIAWEQANQIYIRQYELGSGGYVNRGPFPGYDPLIYNEYAASQNVTNNNLLLFHLSIDRMSLVYRKQSEGYANEYTLVTYSTPMILLGVSTLSYQYALSLLDGNDESEYISEYYPLNFKNDIEMSLVHPENTEYLNAVTVAELESGNAYFKLTAPGDALYQDNLILRFVEENQVNFTIISPQSALYQAIVVSVGDQVNTVNITISSPQNALYLNAVISSGEKLDSVQFALAAPVNASYTQV